MNYRDSGAFIQRRVCRSLQRLDIKEMDLEDCVPGVSFGKYFAYAAAKSGLNIYDYNV